MLLENALFLALKRRNREIHYFENRGECDFITKDDNAKIEAFQACWELDENNREREIKGLVDACRTLKLKEGKIITCDQEYSFQEENVKITILPFWKWQITT